MRIFSVAYDLLFWNLECRFWIQELIGKNLIKKMAIAILSFDLFRPVGASMDGMISVPRDFTPGYSI